jgi:hypothetical protein
MCTKRLITSGCRHSSHLHRSLLQVHGKTAYTEGAKKSEIFERPFHCAIGVVHDTRSLSFFCARDRNYFLEETEPRRKSLV